MKRFRLHIPSLLIGLAVGFLLSVAIPTLLMWDREGVQVESDIRYLHMGVAAYVYRTGRYPDSLRVLVDAYLTHLPKDPWGNEYLYDPPSDDQEYRIYTYGADGESGGEGDYQDIDNRMLWRM